MYFDDGANVRLISLDDDFGVLERQAIESRTKSDGCAAAKTGAYRVTGLPGGSRDLIFASGFSLSEMSTSGLCGSDLHGLSRVGPLRDYKIRRAALHFACSRQH